VTKDERLRAYFRTLAPLRNDKAEFCRQVLDFEPHVGQIEWLQNAVKPENALTTGNRWGKSHIGAADLIHHCIYRDGWTWQVQEAMARKHEPYRGINVALSADQSRLVWHKALAMLQAPKASVFVKEVKQTPFPTIVFVNDSTLEARSTAREGVYLLGHDYDFVNWDEAAFEKKYERIRDNVLRMRLVDRAGTLNHTSTGNGRNEYGRYFLKGLEGRDPLLYAQTGDTRQNTNINLSRVEMNADRMSAKMRQQNIEGAIVDGGGDYFPLEDLNAAHDDALDAMMRVTYDDQELEQHVWLSPQQDSAGMDKTWRDTYPLHRYLHGWDLADKADWCVGITYDISTKPITLVEFERFHKRGWEYNKSRIRLRHKKYGTSRATKLDITGIGDVVVDDLKDIRAEGVNFAGGRKAEMLTNLQLLLASRAIRWPMIRVLHDEHAFYEEDDDDLDTDCVMANCVAGWWLRRTGAGGFGFAMGNT
jgi:hypothetical protein